MNKMKLDENLLAPQERFVRLKVVLDIVPVSKSTWWRGVKSGKYPQPVKFGEKITVWKAEEIQTLIKDMLDQRPKYEGVQS